MLNSDLEHSHQLVLSFSSVCLLSSNIMAEKESVKVGSKVWVKDRDLYGTVRSVEVSRMLIADNNNFLSGSQEPLILPLESG